MLKVKLEVFEGPFDLLFHLIEKNEIDIYDIPIARITEEYLQYIRTMQSLDLHVAGEFLVMASTLLELKAKMLIPMPLNEVEAEDDPENLKEQLVARLIEYRKYKEAAKNLRKKEFEQRKIYRRIVDDVVTIQKAKPQNEMSVKALFEAFLDALQNIEDNEKDERDVPLPDEDEYNVEDRMKYIRMHISNEKVMDFKRLFRKRCGKREIIVTFLALLEMIRLEEVRIVQKSLYGRILIFKKDDNCEAG